jgi:hypothetical protein
MEEMSENSQVTWQHLQNALILHVTTLVLLTQGKIVLTTYYDVINLYIFFLQPQFYRSKSNYM